MIRGPKIDVVAGGRALRDAFRALQEQQAKEKLMAHIKPDVPDMASGVYACLEVLITGLLFRGSTNVVVDAQAMLAELAADPYATCARENVCMYELGRVLATAMAIGKDELRGSLLWPHGGEAVPRLQAEVVTVLEQWSRARPKGIKKHLASHGVPWFGDSTAPKRRDRATTHPRDAERSGFYRELVRDGLFVGRASIAASHRAAKLALLTRPTIHAVKMEMKLIRTGTKKASNRIDDPTRLAAIPPDFHRTLFAQRLAAHLRNPFIAALLDGRRDQAHDVVVARMNRRRTRANSLPGSG